MIRADKYYHMIEAWNDFNAMCMEDHWECPCKYVGNTKTVMGCFAHWLLDEIKED